MFHDQETMTRNGKVTDSVMDPMGTMKAREKREERGL